MEVSTGKVLSFSSAEAFSRPFPYFISLGAFGHEVSMEILTWLETGAPWGLVETSFYEQYEFDFLDVSPPGHLSFLYKASFLHTLKSKVERLFGVELSSRVDLTAHKLIPGQRIGNHNDFIPGQETHRVLIQFNRRWCDVDGGYLLLFNSADSADIHKILRPIHNTVTGLAITPTSYHAVSTIRGSERFTLVYSFYGSD
jgi:Rps23 Pro-64 3,4-dihydroxylase Tpa1-like proline 4-hydroxylase